MRAEALDCLVYAARAVVVVDLDRRKNELREIIPPAATPLTAVPSPSVSAWRPCRRYRRRAPIGDARRGGSHPATLPMILMASAMI
jgi:phage terminase large subunit GpA-like protein